MSQASPVITDVIEPADISVPLDRLRAGEPLVELQHDDIAVRAATLDLLLGRLAEADTRLVWIGNPLRSPLTIERLFLQAAGAEADLRVERTPAELAAILRSAHSGSPRSVLIVQQPETLDPETRDTLAHIAPLLRDATPVIQFLFCGTTAFRPIAPAPTAMQPAPATPIALSPLDDSVFESRASTREKLPLFLLLIIAIAGTMFSASTADKPVQITPITPAEAVAPAEAAAAQPLPAESAPTPLVATSIAPSPLISSPRVDVVALRHEFDTFLAQHPSNASRLTPEQRDTLFREFLAHEQARQGQSPP